MMSSDSQAMGRVGEVIIRTWQTAHKMKSQRGKLAERSGARTTTTASSAISRSTRSTRRSRTASAHVVGSVEPGKLADLVLWKPAFFGVKPELILKGGMIAAAAMGDPNASIPTPQPVHYRPMFGAFGKALSTSVTFVSKAALEEPGGAQARVSRSRWSPVENTRRIGKRDMKHNDALPRIDVDPETYEVRADGELLTCEPASVLPMAQRYFLF